MATEVGTAAKGTIGAVGGAAKAFAVAHPIGMAVAGGALLGLGAYYAAGKLLKKKPAPAQAEAAPAETVVAAA